MFVYKLYVRYVQNKRVCFVLYIVAIRLVCEIKTKNFPENSITYDICLIAI